MVGHETRRELAEFLRKRRARLSPADVGFPPGKGRRTLGLRREEVAALAGVGLTWYTSLEQGKDIRVSTAFLENLARALRLTAAERAHLFALAQGRPPPLPSPATAIATERLQSILDALDCPAYARNSRFDVIAWNAANTRMFGDFANIPPHERNVLWLMFARTYHRHTMPTWEADARAVVAKFRLNFGQAPDAAVFSSLVAKLDGMSADFRRIWADHDVSDLGEGVTFFRLPRHGEMRFQHYLLIPEFLPDLCITAYIAESRATM